MADPKPADLRRIQPMPLQRPTGPGRHEHRLPAALSSFVGREGEVATIADLLRNPSVRLVTLTGPGGVGKTRLAIAAAECALPEFPDGVWFVDLAAVRESSLLAPAVAGVLGVRDYEGRSPEEGVRTFLADRRALLVLDNFEHLLAAVRAVSGWLATCPNLTALATSRTLLRVSSEHDFPVPPLGLNDDRDGRSNGGSAAAQLFAQRAAAVKPGFVLQADNAAIVDAICRRLDGVPLAIELAAVRVRLLPPAVLLDRLQHALSILTGGARDQPERHQTMRAALGWSHDLLTDDERVLFRRLGVFFDGFTLEAVEAVANERGDQGGEPLERLGSLVDQSLVQAVDASASTARFRLLEPVREFALEHLERAGETEAIRARHAAYYAELGLAPGGALPGPATHATKSPFGAELANVRAALGWAAEQASAETGLRLAIAVAPVMNARGHYVEGCGWLERFLAIGEESPPALRASALCWLAWLRAFMNDPAAAAIAANQALPLAEASGDAGLLVWALVEIGRAAEIEGDETLAMARLREAEALARAHDDPCALSLALGFMAVLPQILSDPPRARALLIEAVTLARGFGETAILSWLLEALAFQFQESGDLDQSARLNLESLQLARTVGDESQMGYMLFAGIDAALVLGDAETAAKVHGAASAEQQRRDLRFLGDGQAFVDRIVERVRAVLGDAAFATAVAAGCELGRDAALDLTESVLARAAEELASPSPTAVPAPQPFGLTPRELDVLRLLAADLTNLGIAEALFISEHTVRKHVERILGKLQVESRAGAVAIAVRHGLA